MPPITRKEFAAKVKAKYPEYKDIDDNVLVDKMVAKYPEYKSEISDFQVQPQDPQPEKKKASFGALGDLLFKAASIGAQEKKKRPLYDLEQAYKKKQSAQSKIMRADTYTTTNEIPQSEIDRYNATIEPEIAKSDEEIKAARNVVKSIISAAASAVERDWSNWTQEGIPDYERIYNLAGKLSEKYGGGDNVKEDIAQGMIEAAKAGYIKSEADKKFKQKTGFTVDEFIADKKAKGGVTEEDVVSIQNIYNASVSDFVNEQQDVKSAAADAMPLMQKMGAAFTSGLLGGLASQGSGLAALGVNNKFTDYLRGKKTAAELSAMPQKEWTKENLTSDPLGTVLPFVSQQAGVSLPSMIAGMGVGLATGSGPAGAVLSMLSEKAANVGDTYDALVSEGVNPNEAKSRASEMMRPMITDALNFVEMDILLKGIKGKGKVLTNALGGAAAEVPAEYQQQYEQEKALNPDITWDEFLDKVGGAELGIKTFVSAGAMTGGVSALGKVFDVVASKVPNSLTQKLQNIIQKNGAEKAKEVIAAQAEDGVITQEEIADLQDKVDEIEATDRQLEEMGVAPEARQVATAISTQVADLNQRLLTEYNPAVITKLMQERQKLQTEMDDILSGKKGFVVITPETGTSFTVPEEQAKEVVTDLKDEIENGTVEAKKVGEVKVEIPKRRLPKVEGISPKRKLPKVEGIEPVQSTVAQEEVAQPTPEVSAEAQEGTVSDPLRDVESTAKALGDVFEKDNDVYDKITNLNVLDKDDIDEIEIPENIQESPFWQRDLVEKVFSTLGIHRSKNVAGTGTVYYGIETPNGGSFKLRLSNHGKGAGGRFAERKTDGDIVFNEDTTPEELLQLLKEELPNNVLLDEKTIAQNYHKQKTYKSQTNPELVKAVEDVLKQPTPAANQPISEVTTEPTPKAKEGVTEEVQPSPVSVGQGEAKGTAAVLGPKVGDTVMVKSKHTKGAITYFRKEDGWYFRDSRGKEQKETAKKQDAVTLEWEYAQGKPMQDISMPHAFIETEEGTESIDAYIDKAKAVLKALFPDAKFEVYETQEEYEAATGDSESRGGYIPKEKRVVLNLEKMREDRVAKTPIHEVVHPIVREAMKSDENALVNLWGQVKEYRNLSGMEKVFQHIANYEGTQTQAEEGITEFITRVVDDTIDPSKMSPSIASKFIDLINKLFEAIGINIQFGTPTDLKRLSEAVKSAFETGDVSPLERVLGRRIEVEPQGQLALADKATPEILQDKGKFEGWVKRMVSEYDATSEEIMEAIKEDYPNLGAEYLAELEQRVRGIVNTLKGAKPKKEPKLSDEQRELTGISHAETEKDRIELGLPEYVKTTKSNAELEAEANDMIQSGVDLEAMVQKMGKGIVPTDVEYVVLAKYKSLLRKQTSENPTNENITKYNRLITALEKIGSLEGRAFAARKYLASPETTLADFLVRQMQESEVDVLTDNQIAQNKKEFEEIEAARKEWEAKYNEFLEKYNEELAKQNVNDAKRTTKKAAKTKEDFKKERSDILSRIREKVRKRRGQMSATIVPYADLLFDIAPDVAMLMKSYIEQGITEFAEIVKKVKEEVSVEIPEIQERDVIDIIAGAYSEKKQTRNEISKQLNELRQEAKIMQQIADLESGEEPKSDVKRIEKNRRLKELKDKLKTYPAYNLAQEKKKIQTQITKLENDLKDGNFLTDKPKVRIKLDAEAKALKDKLVKLKTERETRLLKDAYDKRTRRQKTVDQLVRITNIPRSIMASVDFSAPLRQAIIATIANPKMAAGSFVDMFKAAVSQKTFDEWFYDLEQDPRYELMKEFRLGLADPKSPFLKAKEEVFMDGYAERIPGVGKLIKGSERAYVMYLNKMRADLFNRMVDRLEDTGKTPDNAAEVYQATADYINNITGRGSMNKKIEQFAPVLSVAFFSPRLMASRINLLNPAYFAKLPTELKKQYAKDMLAFIATGTAIIGLAYAAAGGDDEDDVSVELDPRSADFMKIKVGDMRWDIWGGFQQYVRLISQFATGQRKSTRTDELTELDGDGAFGEDRADIGLRFIRGKLAPVPSAAINLATGRDIIGQETSVIEEGKKFITPLIVSSLIDAYKESGIKSMFTVGIPSTFGVGVEVQTPRRREITKTLRVNSEKVKLTEEQHEELEDMVNEESLKAVEKVKTLSEYKSAEKKMKAAMEDAAKELVTKKVKDEYIKKNKKTLLQQVEPEDKTEKEAKSLIKKKL